MALGRVLPDTNVCYPISLLDLVLRLDEASLHEVLWTEDLLDELAGKWVEHGIRSRAAAERICGHIRAAFADGEVPRDEYRHLIPTMPGGDPDDHAHAAAAVARAPVTLLTQNVRDFPTDPLRALGVTVLRPDDYLTALFDGYAEEIAQVVVEMAADRHRPPMTPSGVLDVLNGAGVTRFADAVRKHLGV